MTRDEARKFVEALEIEETYYDLKQKIQLIRAYSEGKEILNVKGIVLKCPNFLSKHENYSIKDKNKYDKINKMIERIEREIERLKKETVDA